MFKFFQFHFRNLSRSKLQLSIAFIGLLLGWSSSISIGLFLYNELTYDRFNKKHDRIYRVNYNERTGEIPGQRYMGTVGPTVGPTLKETFPEVESYVRFRYSPNWLVRNGDVQFYENRVWYADSTLFDVFDFSLQEGNAAKALTLPNNVVISRDIARKYFGNSGAVGRSLTMNNQQYIVSGVLRQPPSNSHIQFDFLLPFFAFHVPHGYPVTLTDWGWISFYNYVLLKPNSDAKRLEQEMQRLVKLHWSADRAKRFRLELQPLTDIYLGDAKDERTAEGNKVYLLVLSLSALMIMLTASFNFANIYAAMSIARAKEVGIRKLLGAGRNSLVWRLNSTSMLIVLLALTLSLLLLPLWSKWVPWSNTLSNLSANEIVRGILLLFGLGTLVGIIAGFVPSIILASYNFQSLLKGSFKVSTKGMILRRFMLAGQFVISIALLCSVLIISRQMAFLKKVNIGYAKNELLLIHVPGEALSQIFPALNNKLRENPYVTDASIGGGRLNGINGSVPVFTETTGTTGEPMEILSATFDFFKTAGIPLIRGREFTRERNYDTLRGVILNESAVKALGWTPETAIGKKIRIDSIVVYGQVMGVVKNFNFSSLHTAITPLALYYPRSYLEDIYVRFRGNDPAKVVASLNADWKSVAPSLPFDYNFMTDNLAQMYSNDQRFEAMFRFFSFIAIVIACLGFYSLLSQDIIYRVKEIAVRKVLGASTSRIFVLLVRQYVLLFLLANLIAWPLSYYCMNRWLQEFPYRETIGWIIFPFAGIVFLVLALLSVSYFTGRAARANPVASLKA